MSIHDGPSLTTLQVPTAAQESWGTHPPDEPTNWFTTFFSYYDRTSALAFDIALHLTGDIDRASAACKSAYVQAWHDCGGATIADFETTLKARVRAAACPTRPQFAGEAIP